MPSSFPPPLPRDRRPQDAPPRLRSPRQRRPLRLGSVRLTRLRLTPLQWIGGGATAFLALVGLLSGGLWSAVLLVALVVLITGVYGALLRRPTWLGLARRRRTSGLVAAGALAALLVGTSAYGATAPAPVAQEQVAASTATPAPAAEPTRSASPAPTRTAVPTPTPTVVVTTETVTETAPVPRATRTEEDPTADQGSSVVIAGSDGVLTRTVEIVKHDGVEVSRTQVSEAVTTAPVDDVTRVGTRVPPPAPAPAAAAASGCDSNYTGDCVPIDSDVDCAAGSGNGPSYVRGPVTVVGSDIYDLDRDGDGIACD
ncbi:G5 domain-containing protein [Rathayibacter sp. SD072]|uniref:G5 domain-containing protein n=1 Tax=Rathayibacter sp. SD072 TaxID=2781731 RepID=UPI001A96DAC1|nr:G5 domain-containing protein [Rathayibacter sp. SD072]MBO0984200.1 G5 domain-containing protein [Rathayibacter sp. SD072]